MLYFLLGMLFVFLGVPIFGAIETFIQDMSNLISCKIAKKMYDIKKEINAQNIQEQSQDFQIGFQSAECIGYEVDNQSQEQED